MKQSYFVTTALEETWSVHNKIIFADEACCLYDRRHIWEKCDHTIVPHHWRYKKKFEADYDYLTKLYEVKLVELSAKLNVIHNVNYEKFHVTTKDYLMQNHSYLTLTQKLILYLKADN